MQRFQDKLIRNALITLVFVLAFLMIPATTVLAQRAPSQAELKERRGELVDRELQTRGVVNEQKIGNSSGNQKQLRLVMEQTIQDFDRIQALDREYMIALMAKKEFDYKNLTEMATEIRKRAKRLKDNMQLPPPDDDDKQKAYRKWDEIGPTEMKDALLALDGRIGSFVTNPLFQTSNWLDVPLAKKASRDLEAIIELSSNIKKNAERLSKPSK